MHNPGLNIDCDLVLTIHRMKMWRGMITRENTNNDSQKSTKFRPISSPLSLLSSEFPFIMSDNGSYVTS